MSMRRPLVVGNWKMNGSLALVGEFAEQIARLELPDDVTVVLLPPVAYLGAMARALQGSGIEFGAQNAHAELAGAFTGEIAPEMIREIGAQWLLVGHSERRAYCGETNEVVAEKFAAAVRAGLNPILCVGETLDEREADRAETVVREQVRAVANRVGSEVFAKGTVAYEPVWAIGTGQTATPDQAQAMHALIRAEVAALDAATARQMRVLYGGSMNTENAAMLLGEADIDGGLIGGASLQAASFGAIAAAASAAAR
jgi:triosephosphate isomerase